MDSKEVNFRLLPFDGKKENWLMWSEKFLAKAKKKGYKKILLGKETIPPDSPKVTDKAALQTRELNDEAYNDLILAMNEPMANQWRTLRCHQQSQQI